MFQQKIVDELAGLPVEVNKTKNDNINVHIIQGYIENAVQCNGHGTYMCGICACAPDFFGRRCECDADNMNFGGDLVSERQTFSDRNRIFSHSFK